MAKSTILARSDGEFKTSLARLAFAKNLFEARAAQDGGTERFGATLLFPKSDPLTEMKTIAEKVARSAWGDKLDQMLKNGTLKSPFLDGDGPQAVSKKSGERHNGFAGHTFIRAVAQSKPRVYDRNVNVAGIDVVYSGCWGYAVLNLFAWFHPQSGAGMSFGISMFQMARDGEKLGDGAGSANPDDYFEKIPDEGALPASTQTGAGAGGLFA